MAKATKNEQTLNKRYEVWKVEPVYVDVFDGMDRRIGSKLSEYKKISKLRETNITPDKAEILNQQSVNTLERLYEAE